MNEENCCIILKGKMPRINEKMMILAFFKLYSVYIKRLGQFFFHTYSLICLNKDTSVLFKVSEQVHNLSTKTMVLTSLKKL